MSQINQATKRKRENNAKSISELASEIRWLLQERAKLTGKLEAAKHRSDTLKLLLNCNSKEEVQNTVEEFFPLPYKDCRMSKTEKKRIVDWASFLKMYFIQKFLGTTVRITKSGSIVVQFVPPVNYPFDKMAVMKLDRNSLTYKVRHVILPEGIPLRTLEEDHLKDKNDHNIAEFIHRISTYVWCFWMRDIDAHSIKKMKPLENSLVYFNRARNLISLTISFLERNGSLRRGNLGSLSLLASLTGASNGRKDRYEVELKLHYEMSSRFPDSIEWEEAGNKPLSSELVESLKDLAKSLETFSLSEVLKINFDNSSGIASSDSTSESTIIFDLFK